MNNEKENYGIHQNATKTKEKVMESEKNLFSRKGFIGVAIAVIAALVIGIFFVMTSSTTIDLDKYTTVEFKGYEGYGTAEASVDWDKIEEDYKGKIKFSKKVKEKIDEISKVYGNEDYNIEDFADPAEFLKKGVKIKVDAENNGELSNDDEITIIYEVSEEFSDVFNVKLKAKPKTVKVENLQNVDTEDVFKDIEVTFTGTDGSGIISIMNKSDDYSSLITADKQDSLSNGDIVTLTADVNEFVKQYGKAPEKATKEYKVSGLSKYLSKISELSDSAMNAVKVQAEDVLKQYAANNTEDYSYSTPEYIGAYVLNAKVPGDGLFSNGLGQNNQLGLVYKITLTGTRSSAGNSYTYANEGKTEVLYNCVDFNDIQIDEEGNLTEEIGNEGSINAPGDYSDALGFIYGYKSIADIHTKVVDGNAGNWTADWQVNQ